MERKIDRIKVMLAEKGRTNKWLSEQVGKDLPQPANGVPIWHNPPSKQ